MNYKELAGKLQVQIDALIKTIEVQSKTIESLTSEAVGYSINELEAVRNIIESTQYLLDNNSIERPMRYISISRRNSMFCGSVEGARRMALIYSLAVSCRLNGVNSFSYFCDVLNKLALMSPSASVEQLRDLLPDKWKDNDN